MYPSLLSLRHFLLASSWKSDSRRFLYDGAKVLSPGKYGQPTSFTHPHLLKNEEINKGIQKSEFKNRRENLIEKLLKLKKQDKHLLLLPAAKRKYMVDKIPYFYRKVPTQQDPPGGSSCLMT